MVLAHPVHGRRTAPLAALALVLASAACNHASAPDSTPPTTQAPLTNSLTAVALAPAEGSVVTLPPDYPYVLPGGLVVPKDSGHIALQVDMSIAQDLPYAQLNVYLLTGGTTTEYCGQNTPDSPTWGLLQAGWTDRVTVTGFRVYQLPCEVTGFRAMLHTRNNGLLTPPTSAETVAEVIVPRSFTLAR